MSEQRAGRPVYTNDLPDVRRLYAEDFAVLAKIPWLSGLPLTALRDITAEASVIRCRPGDTLFHQGEEARFLHIVLDGELCMSTTISAGEETVVDLLGRGDVPLAAAVLTCKPYLMSARALTPASVMQLPAERLRHDLRSQPDLAMAMLAVLSEHFRTLVGELKDQKLRSASQRLAKYLLTLTASRSGAAILRLPHSKSIIAARIGIRLETLSRVFSALSQCGVTIDGHVVSVADIGVLATLYDPEEEVIGPLSEGRIEVPPPHWRAPQS